MKVNFRLFSIKFLSFLVAISFIAIVLTCFISLTETNASSDMLGLVPFILMVVLIFFAIFSMKRLNGKWWFIIFLILLTMGLRIYWVLTIHTQNASDFAIMYQGAVEAAKGNFAFTSEGIYFKRWAYQLGFTMYEALILKLFPGGSFTLELINIFYCTGTTLLIYFISRKLFNEVCGRIAGTLYALYIPSISMSSVLTNQHLSTFLFYLSFYLLINYYKKSKYIWIVIGILLSVGDIIRPIGSLVITAIGIYTLIFGEGGKKQWAISAGKFCGILLVFYLTHALCSSLLMTEGVTKYPLTNEDPYWKFVTGLNPKTTGIFSVQDSRYLAQFPLGKARNEASMELIKERISNKEQLLTLFQKKFAYLWTEKDGSIVWGLRSQIVHYTQLIKTLSLYERAIYLAMCVFIMAGAIRLLFAREFDRRVLLFMLLILGYMSIHLLIEIQTRYRYDIIPSFMILQSYGIFTVYSMLRRLLRKMNIVQWAR